MMVVDKSTFPRRFDFILSGTRIAVTERSNQSDVIGRLKRF
jgi:hypothetical protein